MRTPAQVARRDAPAWERRRLDALRLGLALWFLFVELLLAAARRAQMADQLDMAFATFVCGAAIGMGCRFLYWRRRDPWRSGWF